MAIAALGNASPRCLHSMAARRYVACVALLFIASTALTIACCIAMADDAMPMRGWTMSMAWMRMPGQTWLDAALMFTGMWSAMMLAMMLPVIAPALWMFAKQRGGCSALIAGGAYFGVWSALGIAIYPFGIALAALAMQQQSVERAVPLVSGIVVLLAGILQFSAWKRRQLDCCRAAFSHRATERGGALQYGLQLGVRCMLCCANLTLVLLVVGVMEWWAMLAVTTAIAAERLLHCGERSARITGVLAVAAGLLLILRGIVLAA